MPALQPLQSFGELDRSAFRRALRDRHDPPLSDGSGSFWFFRPDWAELTVKLIDGRGTNGKFWFFYGALSDLEYTITVTDTTTGTVRTYHNDPGNICGGADTKAF